MKYNRSIGFSVLCLTLLFLFACVPGKESFKTGQQLSNAQRWEEAIPFYEKAVKENPKNTEYRLALKRSKQEAAKAQYQKARTLLAANPQPNIPTLDKILKEAERAYAYDPGNENISSLRQRLIRKKNELIAQVEDLYDKAGYDLEDKNWIEAIEKLKQIVDIYPGYEETGDQLSLAEREGSQQHYKEGLVFSREEEWKVAAEAFKLVLDINPNYHDTKQLYEKAKANDNIQYYLRKGKAATDTKKWEKAVKYYTTAMDYEPDNEDVYKVLEKSKANAARDLFNEAIGLTSQNRLNKAVYKFTKSGEYDPSLQESLAYRKGLENLSRKLYQRAERNAAKDNWGGALVWLTRLGSISPEYKDLFYKEKAAKDEIVKRIKKSIAVFDFSSPNNAPDAGKIVANKLITFLYEKASGDLRIIERENLQSILKELQLGQTGLIDMETAQQVGKMRGIDIFILGDVLHFTSSTKDFPSSKTVMLKVGTKRVKTQAFLEWEAKHPNPTRDELKHAPRAYEDQPVYDRFSYRAGVTRIISFMEISYKMVQTATGENMFTDTTSGKLSAEDTYNDGVPEGANIKYDPLELPSEVEVLSKLTDKKIAEVGLSVLKHFQSLELVYFNEAEKLLKRREYDRALEKYTDAIFDEKLKGISSPISKKASEMIQKLIQNM